MRSIPGLRGWCPGGGGQGCPRSLLLLVLVPLFAAACSGDPPCTPGCNGQQLTSCDGAGKATVTDCSTLRDPQGHVKSCVALSDQSGFFCIADYSTGCGSETLAGRCDGSKVVRCLSVDSGSIETVDCARDTGGKTACAVAPDGTAGCTKPGTTGCGGVPADGLCSGEVLEKCVDSAVQVTDCSASSQSCGLLVGGRSYGCTEQSGGGGDPSTAVTGTLVYEKRTVDTSSVDTALQGFTATPVPTPVSGALVQLIQSDGTELQRTYSDAGGAFTLHLPTATTQASVRVSASADPALRPVTVRDCPPAPDSSLPPGCSDGVGEVHAIATDPFTGPTDLGQLVITVASGEAGAFNIFAQMLKGAEFARANLNGGAFPAIPPLTVEWRQGFETATSYCAYPTIVVQGKEADTDEFDDPVLLHEFGHFLESAFSKSDSPGGSHDGSPTDPRLAWGEGYGTYVGCRISGASIYFDTSASGTSVIDLNNTGFTASLTDPDGIRQLMSEFVTGEILWRIDLGSGGDQTGAGATNGQGSAPIFDVLGHYFKGNSHYNDSHGVPGRELVKFLDGWFCRAEQSRGSATTPVIQGVVTTDHQFPYDDYRHIISPIASCR